ncbi:molybdopterin oxidoreductase family protein [Gloeobacter kilaueensis]|uniref:Ferredoxin-nitrate reductase n=1 Tax=Gloeobacter kilaueensis (strain ATCC BAA-2537 / CCAP 1431/1 / ULC 316 / JS1) TaxID=1183438 RepID=U5QS39_GLOK1|nr:nitrate reductase [Gloeobacter kilaueensis]AGY60439.1 ferredoxin-nitrate reductase [Gloeobacter kilaueensis JS1]
MPNNVVAKSLCPYCGVGCGLEITADNRVRGDRDHPSSQGMLCVKGATILESIDKDRLLYPMVRESLSEPFRRASWDEALGRIASRLQQVRLSTGPDAICMYGSGQFTTEDYYVAQKLLKGCLGSNHFDGNSRLCMSSAVAGYVQSLGSDGPPACYDDLERTDCAFLIGTNTAECHPIVFNRLLRHRRQNPSMRLVVVDPRATITAQAADLHLPLQPGTDIDLLNGIAHLLVGWGQLDEDFIAHHTTGFAAFAETIRHYPPEVVARRCGITIEQLEACARLWAASKRVLSLWSMGINQSIEGTAKVRALINLHLLTGQIGHPGSGPFSLTGQPNAMGGREAGGLSHLLPGYRFIADPAHREAVEKAWKLPTGSIAPQPGRTVWEMILALEAREVEFFWIAATNPAVSLPDLDRTRRALARSPFTVYQDCYYPTETAQFAHILLPATQWSEKTGTMTNSERRVTLSPAFQQPVGEARDDWQIFAEVGRRLGLVEQFAFDTPASVFAEFAALTAGRPCEMTGISHERLRQNGPLQWPLSSGSPPSTASSRLYTDHRFATPDGRARFAAVHARGLAEPPDPDYPFILTNGRLYGHWHTQTRTGRIEKLRRLHPAPFIEIHPRDATQLDIHDGDWLEVRSRRGTARFAARITAAIAPGVLFVPMHWGSLWADEAEANALTHSEADPDSSQPELKACAVQLVKVAASAVAAAKICAAE